MTEHEPPAIASQSDRAVAGHPPTKRLGPDFDALLAATLVTNFGDGLRLTALPLLATTLTSSPVLISGITAAQFLPWATFAPFGGVIVDRSDRRRLILVTQMWRAGVMALLALAVYADVAQIWHLFVVAFVITVGEILVDPSVVATVPTLVARNDLDRANSRISTVEVVTNDFVGGPAGAIAFGFLPWLPFVLDGLSYLGSTVPFSRLPPSRPRAPSARTTQTAEGAPAPADRRAAVRSEMGSGLRWIRSHAFLRPLTVAIAVFHLGTAGAFSMLILLVIDVLGSPEIIFGVAVSAAAVGATVATVFAARLTDRYSRRIVITAAAALTSLSVIGAGVTTSAWQLVPVWMLNGVGAGVSLSIGRGFVQRHTPNELLGRTAIASRMITRSSFVIGALAAGIIAAWASVRWSFLVAGSLHGIGTVLLWRSFRHERG